MITTPLESTVSISELKRYDMTNDLSHSHFHLQANIATDSGDIIVNTEYLPMKYFDIFKRDARTITLTDAELIKYRYQPKMFCYEYLGSIELWSLLLRLNNMTSITEFNKATFKIPPINTLELLNEVLILEDDNIEKNRSSIGK